MGIIAGYGQLPFSSNAFSSVMVGSEKISLLAGIKYDKDILYTLITVILSQKSLHKNSMVTSMAE